MNIPPELKIGGHIIKVRFVSEDELSDNTTCGKFNRDLNTISISMTLSQSQKESTLLHEIIHALNGELEESFVDSLAEQLYQVLNDNRMLK